MSRIGLLFALMLFAWVGFAPLAAADVRGVARVIDGDTLQIGAARVRLFGIDAPELAQTCGVAHWACGAWARDRLVARVSGHAVTCRGRNEDRYGRLIARCDAGQGDLGRALVAEGAAIAYRRYSQAYVDTETRARLSASGVWRDEDPDFVTPEAFRAQHRHRAAPQPQPQPPQFAQAGCAIKGNISANGRIYHLPGQRDYARTRIDPDRGERWFCSTVEAAAAGWRPARR